MGEEVTTPVEMALARRYSSRKFSLTLIVIIASTILLSASKLTGGEYVTLVTFALGIFAGANVWEKRQ